MASCASVRDIPIMILGMIQRSHVITLDDSTSTGPETMRNHVTLCQDSPSAFGRQISSSDRR